MPLHLPALKRREFLLAASAAVTFFPSRLRAAEPGTDVEDDLVYLLNDTHIGEKQPPDSPVPTHLRMVVDELVQRPRRPAAVVMNGDLALKDGQAGDYEHFARLIAPLRTAGVELHLTLGNHDDRDVFYNVLSSERPGSPPVVASRHLGIVQTRHANLFLLDSLQQTMVTQGTLGAAQLEWLKQALDEHPDKPALIVMHHNPRLGGDPLHFPGGLIDSQVLWQILEPRRQVKACVHGHIHDRTLAAHRGIHIINTPATSYVADRTRSTTGWTTARFTPDGVTLTTHTTDPDHLWNDESVALKWRI